MIMSEIYEKLKAPFKASKISWRVGATSSDKSKGIALAYIDARDVMQRLDDVFGLNWQCKYSHAENKTICEISVLVDGVWISRAGGAGDTDIEAEKGAISDAFKRAAVLFGVGRYLYDLPNQWVKLKPQGKSYAIDERPTLPSGFYPVITQKQAEYYVSKMLDEKTSQEEKKRLYSEAKHLCEEAENPDTWKLIAASIKPKKE